MSSMKRNLELLPQVSFSILMALSLRPRHGYEIMKQAEEDSLGKVKLAPGTLYGTIKQLLQDGLIEEINGEPSQQRGRRYYRLTKDGWDRLNAELEFYDNIVRISKKRSAFERS